MLKARLVTNWVSLVLFSDFLFHKGSRLKMVFHAGFTIIPSLFTVFILDMDSRSVRSGNFLSSTLATSISIS